MIRSWCLQLFGYVKKQDSKANDDTNQEKYEHDQTFKVRAVTDLLWAFLKIWIRY
jgi:hypothetical protein